MTAIDRLVKDLLDRVIQRTTMREGKTVMMEDFVLAKRAAEHLGIPVPIGYYYEQILSDPADWWK